MDQPLDHILATDRSASADRARVVYPVLFLLFFCSGFCGLLYQVVWVRLAFAHFGVITPVLSCVLSVFMLGLGIGSLLGGRLAQRAGTGFSSAYLYGAAELVIGIGGLVVPLLFAAGESYLLDAGEASSARYLLVSAIFIFVAVLPWCIAMGATFPLMMGFIRQIDAPSRTSFSFLYVANVIGAMTGTAVSALVLVELFGFRGTYLTAAAINFSIAVVSFALGWNFAPAAARAAEASSQPHAAVRPRSRAIEVVLFTTGLVSLAMEVVWTRAFTFVLKTTIYSFALILTTYLLATWIGSYLYRRGLQRRSLIALETVLGSLGLFALLPVLLNDPRFNQSVVLTLASIVPFCLALGYLTPRLIDEHAHGNPAGAGRAYAINIAGGIIGPLIAAYLLLPWLGTRTALLALAVPVLLLYLWAIAATRVGALVRPLHRLETIASFAALFGFALLVSRGYEDAIFYRGPHEIRRDHVATVAAYGEGMAKRLLVNGIGMTTLTPITKVMAHLPLAVHGQAKSGLVICFGMGTTFRAMRSWGIDTTVVELSRSVTESFGFFFADADDVVASPAAHVVVDDGRRYLLRSDRKLDVITLDPPPPVEAAGSSLLYSREFYDVVKAHLAPGGILQQWFPPSEDASIQDAVARALHESFPYVVAFRSIADWGYHFLASMTPIPDITPEEFVARLPEAAKRDLAEWTPDTTIDAIAKAILSRRTDLDALLPRPGASPMVTDDRPYNEYFFLRRGGTLTAHYD
jgi:spermidine synthase